MSPQMFDSLSDCVFRRMLVGSVYTDKGRNEGVMHYTGWEWATNREGRRGGTDRDSDARKKT